MDILLTEEDSIKLRDNLKLTFSQGVHEVQFKKKDGSIRVLNGTRDLSIIGQEAYDDFVNAVKKDGTPRKESTTSLSVFDIELKEWRAFTLVNTISIDNIPFEEILEIANLIK